MITLWLILLDIQAAERLLTPRIVRIFKLFASFIPLTLNILLACICVTLREVDILSPALLPMVKGNQRVLLLTNLELHA